MNKALCLVAALILGAAQAASFQLQDTWTFGGHQGEVEWGTLTPDGERRTFERSRDQPNLC